MIVVVAAVRWRVIHCPDHCPCFRVQNRWQCVTCAYTFGAHLRHMGACCKKCHLISESWETLLRNFALLRLMFIRREPL